MHRRLRTAAMGSLLASALSLGGCADSALVLAPDAPDVPFKPATVAGPDGAGRVAGPPRRTPSGARDFGLPPMVNLPLTAAQPRFDARHAYALAELIDLAQTNNPETRVAWERARQAALGVGIVQALYLPVVTATVVGGAQRQNGSSQIGGLPPTSQDSTSNGAVPSVSLQWLIFDFGERAALKREASGLSLASDIAFNGAHQQIIYNVTRSFYEYTAARQRVAISTQAKGDAAHLLDAARDRFSHGLGTAIETAQARQVLAQADFNLVQARGAERDVYHALLAAIGLSPMTVLSVEDVSRRPLSEDALPPIDAVVAQAIARRPDIQAGYAAARAARAGIDAAEADLLPKVFLSASDTYLTGNLNITSLPTVPSLSSIGSGSSSLSQPSPSASSIPNASLSNLGRTSSSVNNATILGGIAIPIYDGGVRQAHVSEARSRSDAAEATVLRLEQAAAVEVVASADALHSSLAAYRAATVLVGASATTNDAAFSAYRSGAGPLTAALETEQALLVARLAQAQAHGTALIAAATLAFSTGRLGSSDFAAFPPGLLR